MKTIRINHAVIGDGEPLYFVADIAANHDGQLERALRLIELAAEAGAHAAKFQNFQARTIVSRKGFQDLDGKLSHQARWKKPVYEVYEDASLSYDWTAALKEKCVEVGVAYMTSPYDFESVDRTARMVDAFKIGSGDITWPEILAHVARQGKPVMLASGASDLEDVQRAVETLRRHCSDLVLMQCNTNYTGSLENFKYVNLNVLKTYRELFPDVILGLSDHTPGSATVAGGVALGARVFEKHFTDDTGRDGPDHPFSMTRATWKEMVARANEVYAALGDGVKRVEENERDTARVQRRALRYTRDLPAGHVLAERDVFPLRPWLPQGFHPWEKAAVLGRPLAVAVSLDDAVMKQHLASAPRQVAAP